MTYCSHMLHLLLFALLLNCAACLPSPDPTPEDQAALEQLQKQFGERYTFAFQYDVYVRVRARVADAPTREEATQIARVFSFDEEGRPRDYPRSHIAYFNFYNRGGRFLFQVYWDPQNSRFEFSDQQFHS